ncbi:hypothetical protein EJD97_001525 [Solanum chilense]|uniref:Uncharacterized protein n=1 Tax=Solanum chilense TaxID=4083 RepID=A0A6N2AP21_SOLCI|nr:hypothetical protein EJD97_001525 [Solanum chilense]
MDVRANQTHKQGLDGRPQNFLAFLMSESRSPKEWLAIAHKNRQNGGGGMRFRARLTLKMDRTGHDGQPTT